MADTRKDRRAPAALRVKYKSATVDQFIEQSGGDISSGGIFVKTKKPLPIGTLLKFEFQLTDASPVMSGVGRVAWRREKPGGPGQLPGMGLKFLKLEPGTQELVDRIVDSRLSGSSRFEQTDGAEVAAEGIAPQPASDPGPGHAPAAPAAPAPPPAAAPPAPAAAGLFGGGTGGAPPPAAPGAVAGLFGGGASRAPRAASRTGGSSFFPAPAASDPSADADGFLASAFSEGGASAETAAEALKQAEARRRGSDEPPRRDPLSEPGSPFAGNEVRDSQPPAAAAPSDRPAALSEPPPAAGSIPPPAAGSIPPPAAPTRPLSIAKSGGAATEPLGSQLDDLWDDDEGLAPSETPAAAPAAPDDGAGRLSESPDGASRLSESMFDDVDLPVDDDFGEADLSASIPPAGPDAPMLTLSTAPPKPAPGAGVMPKPASDGAQQKGGSGGLVVGILLLLAALGGGYFYAMQQGLLPPGLPGAAPKQAAAPTTPAEVPSVPVPVKFTSEPRAARVMVGGVSKGETPTTVTLPSARKTEVTLELSGYAPLSRVVQPGDPPSPEHFELSPLPFEVEVTTEPPGAQISHGQEVAVSPAVLKLGHIEGTATISAVKQGYRRTSRPVRIDEFSVQGEAMRAKLTITLSKLPEGAKDVVPRARPKPKPKPRPKAAASDDGASDDGADEGPPAPATPEPKPKPEPKREAPPEPDDALPDNPF